MNTTYETPRQLELRTRSAAGAVIQLHARLRDPQPRSVASIKMPRPTWSPVVEAAPGEKSEATSLTPQLLKWVAMAAAAAAPWVLLLSGSL